MGKRKNIVVEGNHVCNPLMNENAKRSREIEHPFSIVKDKDGWFLYIGFDYINISFCPCCGEKLS